MHQLHPHTLQEHNCFMWKSIIGMGSPFTFLCSELNEVKICCFWDLDAFAGVCVDCITA